MAAVHVVLDSGDLALVLAGLRLWQRQGSFFSGGAVAEIAAELGAPTSTEDDDVLPDGVISQSELGDRIDELVERINTAPEIGQTRLAAFVAVQQALAVLDTLLTGHIPGVPAEDMRQKRADLAAALALVGELAPPPEDRERPVEWWALALFLEAYERGSGSGSIQWEDLDQAYHYACAHAPDALAEAQARVARAEPEEDEAGTPALELCEDCNVDLNGDGVARRGDRCASCASPDTARVLAAVDAFPSHFPNLAELQEHTGLEIGPLSAALLKLELDGKIAANFGTYRRR